MNKFKNLLSYKLDKNDNIDTILKLIEEFGYIKYPHDIITKLENYIVTYEHGEYLTSKRNSFFPSIMPTSLEEFLALAAMSNNECGIKGEWWYCKEELYNFTQDKIYQQVEPSITNFCAFIDNKGKGDGMAGDNLRYFRKATIEEIQNHFKKEFVLPDCWHVKVTEQNQEVLGKWRGVKVKIDEIVGTVKWKNKYTEKGHNSGHITSSTHYTFGEEITFEQFQEHVLKINNSKTEKINIAEKPYNELEDVTYEIITTHPYFKTLSEIDLEDIIRGIDCDGYKKLDGYDSKQKAKTLINLFKQGINDKKICGYKLIKPEFKKAVIEITKCYHFAFENFEKEANKFTSSIKDLKEAGVLDLWFEPIYEEEVKVVRMGGLYGFELKIKDNKVYHNIEDITNYVLSIQEWHRKLPTIFDKYSFDISDIQLRRTGCESKPTTVDEWLAVAKMIK